MTTSTRAFSPVLSSPGPVGGMIALGFEAEFAEVWLREALADEAPLAHAGQRVVDALFDKHGVHDRVMVETSLDVDAHDDPAWTLSLAVAALCLVRDTYTGLSEVLYAEDMLQILEAAKVAKTMLDGHRVRAALEGGVHARVDRDGGAVAFDLPDAAMIWLRPPLTPASKIWTQVQSKSVPSKRASATSDRTAAAMLRAACNDGLAIYDAWEATLVDEDLLAAYPGWLPASQAAREHAPGAYVTLVGAGPDMLIVADNEDAASRAATAALQTFHAHALECRVFAWSSLPENE